MAAKFGPCEQRLVLARAGHGAQAERATVQLGDRQADGGQAGVTGDANSASTRFRRSGRRPRRAGSAAARYRARWAAAAGSLAAALPAGGPSVSARQTFQRGLTARSRARTPSNLRLEGRAEARVGSEEGGKGAGDVEPLQHPIGFEELRRPAVEDLHLVRSAKRPAASSSTAAASGSAKAKASMAISNRPGRGGTGWRAQQAMRTQPQPLGVARQQADRVVARREGHDAVQREAAVAGPPAVQAAETRRHAHRAAGIGAEPEIGEARRHRDRRAARGAAGQTVGRARIDRRAVMGVLAFQAEAQLVGHGLADQGGSGAQQAIDDRCGPSPPAAGAAPNRDCRRRSRGRRRRSGP